MSKLLTTTALMGALMVFPAAAQQSGQSGQSQSGSGQQQMQQQAQSEGSQIYIGPNGTREIQRALNQAGFDVGSVDGEWNSETQEAARNYQEEQGLAPTGTLTVATLSALGLENLLRGETSGSGGQSGEQSAQGGGSPGEGTPIHIGPEGIRQIQQALNEAGYDVGSVDGQWNSGTQEAARNFAQAQGIQPSDNLHVGLISALDLSQQILQGQGGGQGQSGGQQSQQTAQSENTGEGTPLYMGSDQIDRITQALNQAGFDAGSVDGSWSDGASEAARNFQTENGLEPTGSLTTALLAELGMTDWMQGGGASSTGSVGGQGGGMQQGGQGGGQQPLVIQEGGGQSGGGEMTPAPIRPQ